MDGTNRYVSQVPGLSNKEESTKSEVDANGSRFVNQSVRHAIAATVAQAIPHGPCDYLMFSVDCTATIQHAEDAPGEAIPIPVKGGVWIASAALEVTAVTNAATVVAGFIRRPAGA